MTNWIVNWKGPYSDEVSSAYYRVDVYAEEQAPSLIEGQKYQTWYFTGSFVDGFCMNCRKVVGEFYPEPGYYACSNCVNKVEEWLSTNLARVPPVEKNDARGPSLAD